MRPLTYSINVTLDGCVDHREPVAVAELHRHAEGSLARADALLLGRVTYQMMEDAWRPPASDTLPEWTQPFARVIDAAKKYVGLIYVGRGRLERRTPARRPRGRGAGPQGRTGGVPPHRRGCAPHRARGTRAHRRV